MMTERPIGVLLVNLGTPDDPSVPSVRRYLRQFLSDPRVIDIPDLSRWLLLNFVILPRRPKESAHAYQSIWTFDGSPLMVHSRELARLVQAELGDRYRVELAMRYQNPSIPAALAKFDREGIDRIVVLPLFPQYASSSGGSAVAEIYQAATQLWNVPNFRVIEAFYDQPDFIDAWDILTRETLGDLSQYDHFIFSYHGLPERQVKKSDLTKGGHCLATDGCCDRIVKDNQHCYRAQCFATTRALTKALGISPERYTICFQSRLGRDPWIKPYTDHVIVEKAKAGIKRAAIFSPAFTADCLETIEELGIRAAEEFVAAGGESLKLVPSLNTHPRWVEAVTQMVQQTAVGWESGTRAAIAR